MRRSSLLLFLTAVSCATAKPAPPPPPPPVGAAPAAASSVEEVRGRIRALLRAQAEMYWKAWVAGESVDMGALEREQRSMCVAQNLTRLQDAGSEATGERRQALAAARLYLASECAALPAQEASQAVAGVVAHAALSLDSGEIHYRDLDLALASEAHAGNRRKIAEASGPVVARLRPLIEERRRRVDEGARSLGWASGAVLAQEAHHVEPERLRVLAEGTLAATDAAYGRLMRERVQRELTLSGQPAALADFPRMLRTGEMDSYFPKDAMVARLEELLAGFGFGSAAAAGLKVDAEARVRKSPRALALPFDPPEDVRLSMKPADGIAAQRQLLHEVGHGLAFARAKVAEPELRLLGREDGREVAASLLEGIVDEPQYGAAIGMPDEKLARHLEAAMFRRLLGVRRDAARVLCAAGGTTAECSAAMGRAHGVTMEGPLAERELLLALQDAWGAADRLRGAVGAAQVRSALVKQFGARWWTGGVAAEALGAVFGGGGAAGAEDIVRKFGAAGLDPADLAQER